MNANKITETISEAVTSRGCFLVEVSVSKDNDILITIESENSVVTLEDCEFINDAFTAAFDRDVEDYSLTVSSAGLDRPFKVAGQFRKAVGSDVEVALKGGKKLVAELLDADNESITIRYRSMDAVEGQKKKVATDHEERLTMDQVNSVRPHIVFE